MTESAALADVIEELRAYGVFASRETNENFHSDSSINEVQSAGVGLVFSTSSPTTIANLGPR